MRIATEADLMAFEERGYDAAFPLQSPWQIIAHQAERAPDATAIRYLHDAADPAQDEIISYGLLARRIMAAARLFIHLGAKREQGRSIALLGRHTPAAHYALWGAQIVSAICPINPTLKPGHIAALLEAAGADIVVLDRGAVAGVAGRGDILSGLRAAGVTLPVLCCDGGEASADSHGDFESMLAGMMDTDSPPITPQGDADSIAAYYHTGGTTGTPKLVRHTRRSEAHVARSCALYADMGEGDVLVNGFPLFHVAGAFVYGLSAFSAGGSFVIPGPLGMRNRMFLDTIWEQVERLGITIMGVVPTLMSGMVEQKINADIARLRLLFTGGTPLPPELARATEDHTGKPVRNIFGMTESSGAIAVEPFHGERVPHSCGLRLPFTEVAILDDTGPDPAKPRARGETGIIAIRGPNISPGYTVAARNEGVFLPGGWLISGDLGKIDAGGRVFITGRKKDVIIRGSHNIDPQIIEDALLAHPDVTAAAAVGMPDAYAGELPVAFVTLREGAAVDGAGLIDFLRGRIEDPVALPKRIGIVEAMPLTPIGKIFKPALRREAITWALHAVAEQIGLAAADISIAINEAQEVRVTIPQDKTQAMQKACRSMPITITITDGG